MLIELDKTNSMSIICFSGERNDIRMEFQPEWIEKYHVSTHTLSDCVVRQDYLYQEEKGSIWLCRPWPGIAVWVNETLMSSLPCETAATDFSFVKLNYCTLGRCEVLLENGKYVYLSEGMLSIDCNQPKEMFRYPTNQYKGLEIVWNLDELMVHPAWSLEELGIGTGRRTELMRHNQGSYIAGVSSEWDALARSLMHRLKAAESRIEDYRFLCLQLLYMLSSGHTRNMKKTYATKGQRRIVEEAKKRMDQSLPFSCTVEQLALQVGVSPSSLKKYFHLIYGCSISEYVRGKRIEKACGLLRDTDLSIGDVAERSGYAHQGKFGSVFKKHTGQTPLEYRRRNRMIKEGV